MRFERSKILYGDCIDLMDEIEAGSVDMICADLPYGVTENNLDIIIPFDVLWEKYRRVLKPNGVVALYAQGLFYVDLVQSNRRMFKYDLVWNKVLTSGGLNAKRQPLRVHEQIAIFYNKNNVYNPQMTTGSPLHGKGTKYLTKEPTNNNYGKVVNVDDSRAGSTSKYPKSILTFQKPHPSKARHRTQKSVECNEWLVKTYTNEGDLVLDNTSGSGTLGVACLHSGRDFILMEKNKKDFLVGLNAVHAIDGTIYTNINK